MADSSLFPTYRPERRKFRKRARSTGPEFESLIQLSARSCPRLAIEQLPRAGAQFIGPGKYIPKPVPCDFIGVIAGMPLFFDAKSNQGENAFKDWNNPSVVKPHQREFLIRMGRAGAVSGILAEASDMARVYWMPWQVLLQLTPSFPWDDPRLYLVDYVRLGQVLRFQSLVGWALLQAAKHAG